MLKLKKIFALVLASALLLSMAVFADEETARADSAAKEVINGIGLLTDYESPNGASIKRGEFAHAVAQIMNLSGKAGYENVFRDVSGSTAYSEDICMLSGIGVLRGYTDGTFRPNDSILLRDAVKVILSACGYTVPAERAGGYFAGYLTYAQRTKLLDKLENCDLNAEFTSDVLYRLLYNALDINIMASDELTADRETLKEQKGKTILTEMLHLNKDKGVVTATEYSAIDERTGAGAGKVRIDKIPYYMGECDPGDILGCEIEYYYRKDNGENVGTLVFAMESEKNDVLTLDADDITEATDTEIRYFDEKDKERRIVVDAQTDIVYNGGLYVPGGTESLKIDNGFLRFVDNNGDGHYEVIIAKNYRSVYTVGLDRTEGIIYDTFKPQEPIRVYDYENVQIYDRNGDIITLDSIESIDDLLMCVQSADKSNLEIRQVVNEVVGAVEGTREESGKTYVVIAGTEYRVADHLKATGTKWKIGDKVICYLDSFGKIAALSSHKFTSGTWAYLKDVRKKGSSISNAVSVQILDVNCEDSELKIIDCAERVTIDGIMQKTGNAIENVLKAHMESIVLYYLNADGLLAKVETVDGDVIEKAVSNQAQLVYDEDTKIIGGKIPVSPSTNVFYAPPDGNEDDYTVGYVTNSFIRDQYCYIKDGYRKAGGGLTIDALLMSEPLSGGALTKQSPVMLAERVIQGVNADNDAVSVVCGYVGGTYKKFTVSDETVITKMKALNDKNANMTYELQSGDLIRYELNTKGELKIAELVYRCANGADGAFAETNPSDSNYFDEKRTSVGYVYHKDGAVLMVAADKNALITGNENVMECVRASGGCAIYIYDKNEPTLEKQIRLGGADDVYDYKSFGDNASQIAMYMGNGAVKALIVIK